MQLLSGFEKSLFQVAKTLAIASRLFWRPEKASLFRFEKSPFQPKKALCFWFGKPAFWTEKSDFFQIRKIRFFWSPRRSKLRQGCSDALKRRPFPIRKIAFSAKKSFLSFRFEKIAFSGRQDARNCVKAPSKSFPFQVRKNRLFS